MYEGAEMRAPGKSRWMISSLFQPLFMATRGQSLTQYGDIIACGKFAFSQGMTMGAAPGVFLIQINIKPLLLLVTQ